MRRRRVAAATALVAIAAFAVVARGEEPLLDSGDVETPPVVVGQPLPDLRLPTLDRKRAVRLSSFRGKKLLLIEFASW